MQRTSTFLLLLFLITSNMLWAIPAKQINKTFIQPDGTKLTILLRGDEHFHYYSTTDGVMLKKDIDGAMKYATINSNGEFVAGKYVASEPKNRKSDEVSYIQNLNKEKIYSAISKIRANSPIMRLPSPVGGSSQFPNKGEVRGLIIMAEFTDQKFSDIGTRAEFEKMMNEKGYSNYNATGSTKDYFMAQSNGQFIPTFDVVGPVSLPQNMEYYGGNSIMGQDKNPGQMTIDACKAANQAGIDFSQYDFDNDGNVDLVYILYAGYNEAQGASANTIWPHAGNVKAFGVVLNGKKITRYACSSELRNSTGEELDGVGTFCHEFSHCLGLPDMYDVDYKGGYGLGKWDIMDSGPYNNKSKTPPNYSAFERYSIGWLEPDVLTGPQKDIKLEPLNISNKACFVKSNNNENEYYTIENRQQTGWDTYLPGHGMMIVHINYESKAWINNAVNSKGNERIQIVAADGELSETTIGGDAFPGTSFNHNFTDISNPAASLRGGGYLGKPITEIKESSDGNITFNFMDKLCPTPEVAGASNVNETTFTANWKEAKGVDSYILEVAPYTAGEKLIDENFSKFTEGTEDKPDATNVADKLDDYTTVKGWTGSEIYQAGGMSSFGSGSNGGYLISPKLSFSNNNVYTLCVEVATIKSVINGLQLSFVNMYGDNAVAKNFTNPSSLKKTIWVFNVDNTEGYIRIATTTKSKVKSITLYTGDVKAQIEKGETPSYSGNTEIQIIPDITTNSYKLENLERLGKYIYNVRSKVDDMISGASDKVLVELANGIESESLKEKVTVLNNTITIVAEKGEQIGIYTVDGVRKYDFKAQEGDNSVEMGNGVYIIRIGNASTKAIVLGQ